MRATSLSHAGPVRCPDSARRRTPKSSLLHPNSCNGERQPRWTKARGLDTTQTIGIDPLERTLTVATSGGQTATNHYDGEDDNAAWTTETTSGTQWTRNIADLTGDLAAIQDSTNGVALQLPNLHGDIVATASASAGATGLTSSQTTDEFGTPTGNNATRYGYLGAKQRPLAMPAGTILMGQRAFEPSLGRFLQTDPIAGGSANDYDYVNQDPADQVDLSGERAGAPPPCLRHRPQTCRAVHPSKWTGIHACLEGAGSGLLADLLQLKFSTGFFIKLAKRGEGALAIALGCGISMIIDGIKDSGGNH